LPNAVTLTVPGGDHSLNVPGDPLASIQALELVVRALLSFLDQQL
jgi:hypothetical protein